MKSLFTGIVFFILGYIFQQYEVQGFGAMYVIGVLVILFRL